MSELTLTLLRLGFLALLWLLVMSVVAVLRRDLFGTRVTRRQTPAQPSRAPRRRPAASAPPAGPPGSQTPRTLVVTEGSLRGTTIALGQAPILVGRAPECTLVLEDDYASGRHARFSLQAGTWILEDLGSTNGTYLGRTKVSMPVAVDPGTPVRIGRTVLELRR
ncbi:MAG TPA: FHA domain-containing protein [Kineosporiaceae bacterium]